jgi:hypothetical protein
MNTQHKQNTLRIDNGVATHEGVEVSWHDISEEAVVDIGGTKKTVRLGTVPIEHVHISHGGLETSMDVPSGCSVYHVVCMRALFSLKETHKQIGVKVGLVKDGVVVEERFLDTENNAVKGVRF